MTLWDSLAGRKGSSSSLASPATPTSSEFVAESTYSTSSPSGSSAFPSSSPVAEHPIHVPEAPSSGTPLPAFLSDPSLLNPLTGLPAGSLDYLKLEDAPIAQQKHKTALPARGFSDDLCYGTGCTYLTALSLGGAMGLVEGIRQVPAHAPPKLKLNAILNGVTRRGPFLGNSAGVIALLYNCVSYSVGYIIAPTPIAKYDSAKSILAGGLTGMIFKSTRGPKPMLISGGLVAGAAAAWTFGKRLVL